jgi:deoxyribonuclease-4
VRLGIHTSIAGALERAAFKAADLGANTFQIFSASPRMWRAGVPDPAEVERLRAARERFDLSPLSIHVNYLVNLASLDPAIRARSIRAFRGELERAIAIGAEFLIVHPGSYRGHSIEESTAAFAQAVGEASRDLDTGTLTLLLENTAGAGNQLGSRFEELRSIRESARDHTCLPIGYCLDTCHLLAAGFPIAAAGGLRATVQHAEEVLGLSHVHLIHANDSRGALGSHLDRHANIGEGNIGEAAFHRILTHPKLRRKPFILETPVDHPGDDRRNMDALKALALPGRAPARRVTA